MSNTALVDGNGASAAKRDSVCCDAWLGARAIIYTGRCYGRPHKIVADDGTLLPTALLTLC